MPDAVEGLTPKQQEVLKLLRQQKSIPDIAKRLKISTSGVYGHVRKIRAAGIEPLLDDAEVLREVASTAVPATPTSVNGVVGTPEESIRSALSESNDKLGEIGEVIAAANAAIHDAETEKVRLIAWIEKLDKAQQALA